MADAKLTALTNAASVPAGALIYVVTDPLGTPLSQKATAGTFRTPEALVLNITGTWTQEPIFKVVPQHGVQYRGVFYSPSGAWIESFDQTGGTTLTSLEFANLAGVTNTFGFGGFEALTTLEFPALVVVFNNFTPNTFPLLTTFSVPALVFVGGDCGTADNDILVTLDYPVLTTVRGAFNPSNMAALTDLTAPMLTYVGGDFALSTLPLLDTVDFTALEEVGGNFNPSNLDVLTAFDVSSIASIGGGVDFEDVPSLTSLAWTALTTTGGISADTMTALTSYTLSAIVNIGGGINFSSGTDALATFTLGASLLFVDGDVEFSSCALLQASVDNILVRLAALDGTGGTTTYDNHTVTITGTSASPSGTGLTAKATLEGRGNTVTVN